MLVEMMVKVLERLGPLLLLGTGRLDQDVINKDDGDLGDLAEALVVFFLPEAEPPHCRPAASSWLRLQLGLELTSEVLGTGRAVVLQLALLEPDSIS